MRSISLFVVDDHEMMRIGLREVLAVEEDIEIAGEATGFNDALDGIVATEPDVALVDVRLGSESGIALCRELGDVAPSVRCLMYTSATGEEPLHQSILAGAAGYLLKDSPRDELIGAIRQVASGRSLIDPVLTGRVLDRLRDGASEPSVPLTLQESKVLDLIGEGLSNKEIADALSLAEQTVKNYVSRVLTKLEMRRTQAALYAAGQKRPGHPPSG